MTEIKGMKELLEQIEKIKGIKTNTALLAGAMKLQEKSQLNAPVKTGYLRSSAESHETDKGAELVYGAEYSYYQEMGTSKMPGKFFVSKAVDENQNEIVEAIKNQMEKEIGGSI